MSFPLLGRAFRATGVGPALERWLRAVWEFPDAGAGPSPFRITLHADSEPLPARASAQSCRVGLFGQELSWWSTASEWWSQGPHGGLRLRLAPEGAEIALWPTHPDRVEGDLLAGLFAALAESVRASGLLPLHAAVAARCGRATAFVACSGTGKTSTLVAAARAGWTAVAEDFAWLEPRTLRVFGWDRGVHLWPAGRARLDPELQRLEWTTGPDGKLYLPLERLGGVPGAAGQLDRIVLLRRDGSGRAGWEAVDAREAVRALWECVGVPLWAPTRARTGVEVARLLRTVKIAGLHLHAGSLPLDDGPAERHSAA